MGRTRRAFGEVGSVAGQVAAIGVGGQQHGMVVLDADNRPLRPAKLWNDTESAAEAARLTEAVGAETWAARVGSVPVASFTISSSPGSCSTNPTSSDASPRCFCPTTM